MNEWLRQQIGICIVGVRVSRVCVCVYGCVYGCFVVLLFGVICFVIWCNVFCEGCVWCVLAVFLYVVAYGSVL